MKALLLVSFGTSVNEARKNTIDRLVLEAREAFCDHSVSLAFTSGVIIKNTAGEGRRPDPRRGGGTGLTG